MRADDEFLLFYEVRLSEPAEAELEAGYLRLSRLSLDAAERWNEGILTACRSLSQLPRRFPLAPDFEPTEQETRRLLFGRGQTSWWILYAIFEAAASEPAFVRILHLRHYSAASSNALKDERN